MSSDLRPIAMRWTATTAVLVPVGDLDLVMADDLDFAVRELASSSATHIVIDLSGVDFVDAVGVRALRRARDVAAASGRPLTVIDPTPAVARVLEITGTGDLLSP